MKQSITAISNVFNHRATKGLPLLLIALAVIGFDQLTKYLVRDRMDLGQSIPEEGFFRLTHTTNTGGAFGLFNNQAFLLAVVAIIGIAILVLYLRYMPPGSKLLKAGLGLDLGGAVGNLIDRIHFGEVTDFIDVGCWPVFNLADSSIVVGTILIACYLLLNVRKKAT